MPGICIIDNAVPFNRGGRGPLKDRDGNIYTTVTIGTQEWMVENLKVTKYADGSDILFFDDVLMFGMAGSFGGLGACCYYADDVSNKTPYGLLYNWYAVNTGLAYFTRGGRKQSGWRICTAEDIQTLAEYIGGIVIVGGYALAGGYLKEAGTDRWDVGNDATNDYGLTLVGGGNAFCDDDDGYSNQKAYGDYWISDDIPDAPVGASFYAEHDTSNLYTGAWPKYCGISVRCVRNI